MGIPLLTGCKPSIEKRVKAGIKEWVNQNINDQSSYEPVSFSPIDTFRLDKNNDLEYQQMINDTIELSEGIAHYKHGLVMLDRAILQGIARQEDINQEKEIQKTVESASLVKDSLIQRMAWRQLTFFDKTLYKVTHKFRGTNALNAKVLTEYTFILSNDFKVLDNKKN